MTVAIAHQCGRLRADAVRLVQVPLAMNLGRGRLRREDDDEDSDGDDDERVQQWKWPHSLADVVTGRSAG